MTTAPAPAKMQLRVTFADNWMTRAVTSRADESISAIKSRVLQSYNLEAGRAPEYEVKHGGVPVRDESRSLSALGIRNGAALIVLARRRRAVR